MAVVRAQVPKLTGDTKKALEELRIKHREAKQEILTLLEDMNKTNMTKAIIKDALLGIYLTIK